MYISYDIAWCVINECKYDTSLALKCLHLNSTFFQAGKVKTLARIKSIKFISKLVYKWWLRRISRIPFDKIIWKSSTSYRSFDYSHRKNLPHWVAITTILIKRLTLSDPDLEEYHGTIKLFTTGAHQIASITITNNTEWQQISFFQGNLPLIILAADFVIQSDIPIQLFARMYLLDISTSLDREFIVKLTNGGYNSILITEGIAIPRFGYGYENGVPYEVLKRFIIE